jgi:ATP-dependent DNA helicase RecQ
VSIYTLSGNHDIRTLVVKTLLTYLELENLIQSTGPFYSGLKFQPQKSSQEILGQFDAQRAEFLGRLFRQARKGKKWFSLEVDQAAAALGESRGRVMAAIGYLEEQGDLIVEASGLREGYRIRSMPSDLSGLAASLEQRFARREELDIGRTARVQQYAVQPGCLTRHVLDYFGEAHDDCGHCSRCAGVAAEPLPPPSYVPLNEANAAAIRQLQAEQHDALGTPRQLTRFLCGLSSPAITKAKLRKHSMFGAFDRVPFLEVLQLAQQAALAGAAGGGG